MLIDITLCVTPQMLDVAWSNTDKSLLGHLGTHFDIMNKDFPLDYTKRKAIVFDVSHIRERDIEVVDINIELVKEGMFVAFYTGFADETEYGTSEYFKTHPQLSDELISKLLDKRISVIGIDCSGIRRGTAHVKTDQKCADRGVFVVENLCGLNKVLAVDCFFTAHTYPLNVTRVTGLPCRVIAECYQVSK